MRRTVIRWVVPILAVAVLAVGLVGWWRYLDLTSGAAADNQALVDEKETARVQSEVAQALERVLSYDHADPATTEAAADQLLSGDARKEYDTLFAALQEKAPDQELVLTAQVVAAGVAELDDTSASVLVFIDQSSRRAGDDEANVSAAQISVTARQASSGSWTITDLQVL